ncbi:TIGR03089 family protein [Cellulomonas massiliensis]|uniref:TIGR03089 family protein n=1 Tax=Cellulomonas massiliensis TaxID=1465811 RepID=UPI000360F9FF|nr:TIGR03089 family protein [Cellulomonas massiliensis]
MRTVADVLALLERDPGRPRLTWYGPDGERVELSGAVLVNWVSKTTNLLVEEFDAGPGSRVRVDLPGHWRSVVWQLAAWRVGACLVDDEEEVLVTDAPPADAPGAEVVAVALPALARRFDGALPPGAIDAAAAVMTYGDRIGWAPVPDPASPAVDRAGTRVAHADLVETTGSGERVLLAAPRDARGLLGRLAADASLVLTDGSTARALLADGARRERLVATERVTLDLLG